MAVGGGEEEDWDWALEALRGTVRLESCFPPFLRRGGVLVRVRAVVVVMLEEEEEGLGPLRRWGRGRVLFEEGRWCGWGRGRVGMSAVGSFARIAGWGLLG